MEDKPKADLLLMGVILTFLFLTLLAFLLNEGKKYCVTPFKERYFPRNDSDDVLSDEGDYTNRIAGVYDRRSTYASTKNEAGFSESREMNTIVERNGSGDEQQEQHPVKKKLNDTKM